MDEATYRGGAQYLNITGAGTTQLGAAGKVVRVLATALGVILELPPPRNIQNFRVGGGPVFIFFGVSGSQPYTVQIPGGATTFSVTTSTVLAIYYVDTGDGTWSVVGHDSLAAPAPTNPHWNGIVCAGDNYTTEGRSQHMVHPTDTWSVAGTPMGLNAEDGAAVSLGRDECYFSGSENAGTPAVPINTAILRFSRTGVWSAVGAKTTVELELPMAGAWYQKGFFFNGKSPNVDQYDPVVDVVSIKSPTPIARPWGAGATIQGANMIEVGKTTVYTADRIILIGGAPKDTPPWLYHVPSDTYEHVMPYGGTNRRKGTAGPYSNIIVYAGGASFDEPTDVAYSNVDLYFPISRTWLAGPALPLAVKLLGSFTIGGAFYVMGGNDDSITLSSVAKFEGIMWAVTNPMPVAVQGICNACSLAIHPGP